MRWRRRGIPALVCATTVVVGLVVDATGTGPVADKLGDVLYALLVVAAAWVVRPDAPVRRLATVALAWCVGVELLQLTGLPRSLASQVPAARLVLGSGFDALDLPAYAAGCLAGAAVVAGARRRTGDHRSSEVLPPALTRRSGRRRG